jgi:hypothetical protein
MFQFEPSAIKVNIEELDPQSWIICYHTARLGSIPKMIRSIALCNIKYHPQLLSSVDIALVCVKFIEMVRYTHARESEIAQEEELEVFVTTFAPHTMLARFLFWNLQPRQ